MTPDQARFWDRQAVNLALASFGGTFTSLGLSEGFGNDRWALGWVLFGFGLIALGLFAARVWVWRTGRWPR